jgi:LPS export ABC transporter protein LptC
LNRIYINPESAAASENEVDSHFVDLFMRNFTLTAMNEDGKPGYTLQASYFEHYNDGSPSRLEKPVIQLLQDKNNWVITARSGQFDKDNNLIILHDDVVMQQQQVDVPVQAETSQLEINTSSQVARTDHQVNITQGKLELESRGMILNNSTGEFELLASVRGNYVQAD